MNLLKKLGNSFYIPNVLKSILHRLDLLELGSGSSLPYTFVSVDVDTTELTITIRYNNIVQNIGAINQVTEVSTGYYAINMNKDSLANKQQVLLYNENYNGNHIQFYSLDENGLVFVSKNSANAFTSFTGIFTFDVRVYN